MNKAFLDYLKLSVEDKNKSDKESIDIPALVQFADDFLRQIVDSFNRTYYVPQNGQLSLQWSTESRCAAWINAAKDSSAPFHTIYITYELLIQLAADGYAFTRYAIQWLNRPFHDVFWESKGIEKNGIGIFPLGIDPLQNKRFLMMNSLHWIVSHEIAHSLQSHAAVRSGVPHQAWMGPSHVSESPEGKEPCSDVEAEIFQCTELAADFEALRVLFITLVTSKRAHCKENSIQEDSLTKNDIWTLFLSIALVFLRFHHFDGKRFDGIVKGHHPHPSIRYLLLSQSLIGLIVKTDLKELAGLNFSEEEMFEVMTGTFWVALIFWAERYETDYEVISFGEVVTDPETIEVKRYLSKIVSRWDELRPIIRNIYKNDFLLMEFNIFARRVSGIPLPQDEQDGHHEI
ncbi:hypothetical protein [Pseudomonas sp. PS01301]|uniref:hypothetical protein n=1 Tax=Pseudomonas sp. PS01301 TaxID=2991437 RepID=UPI00249C9745|nr:hypothetical protein [Pseudomonas sp. PS01301]